MNSWTFFTRAAFTKAAAHFAALGVALCLLPTGSAADERAEALAHFEAIAPVFLHPRCRNCHSAGDAPLQGEAGRPHSMLVKRGPAGFGVPGQMCLTCHAESPVSNDAGMPPAIAGWRMPTAGLPMFFEGLSTDELCRRLNDPKVTGRPTVRESMIHVLHDGLVSWAFEPGRGRSAPPLGKEEFFDRLGRWVRGGAPCPE